MYSGLLIILAPLIAGYLIPVCSTALKKIIGRGLSAMVYVILFLMGISLALVENLGANLLVIVQYTTQLQGFQHHMQAGRRFLLFVSRNLPRVFFAV